MLKSIVAVLFTLVSLQSFGNYGVDLRQDVMIANDMGIELSELRPSMISMKSTQTSPVTAEEVSCEQEVMAMLHENGLSIRDSNSQVIINKLCSK